jgi:CRISPR-associated Csx2 family protein
MRRVLITFLGKVQKPGEFYQQARYDFGNGAPIEEAAYMGAALLQHLRRPPRQPVDLVVLLGTRSSMWDVFVEQLQPGDDFVDERVALIERVHVETVDQPCLDSLCPLISRVLGVECRARLIGMARQPQEQIDILHTILDSIGVAGPEDELIIDVTHGFRHLPMLGLLAAMYFDVAFKARIDGIYYGAFDMRESEGPGLPPRRDTPTPVVRLDGLLQIGRWIRVMHAFNRDADLAHFVPLLKEDHVVTDAVGARALWRLAYFERTGQVERAHREAERFRGEAGQNWSGVSGLFENRLLERLPQPGQSLYDRQRQLAFLHLEHRDYVRAAILGFEAVITRLALEAGEDPGDPAIRDWIPKNYRLRLDRTQGEALDGLRHARNALAHADEAPHETVVAALANPDGIGGFLNRRLRQLLP